jgi:quercetin dioxygenase-like cupin family protein
MTKNAPIALRLAPVLAFGVAAGPVIGADGEFVATPLGAGTYMGGQGPVGITVEDGERREIVTVVGDMPVGSNVGFHYHPGHAFVIVIKGTVASLDSASCEPEAEYSAGEAFFDFPGHRHDIVNVGQEPAQFIVTFLLEEGEEALYPVEDPGVANC